MEIGSQPVYNLNLKEAKRFCVGERGMLVHDKSLTQPVQEPFDAMPELDVASRFTAAIGR